MIIDAFLYAGEADMLELRLRTLDPVVDLFVAVEANVTHQGAPRAFTLGEMRTARWERWQHKLGCWYMTDGPTIPDRGGAHTDHFQVIERWHRDQMAVAARWTAENSDRADDEPVIVMCSDVDEIPNPYTVRIMDATEEDDRWWVCEQRFHSTAFDLLHPQQPWLGTCISSLARCSPQAQRDDRGKAHSEGRTCPDGGWHFSWFGNDEERQRKLDSFSHAELRGVFDPMTARYNRTHANGEPLRHLSHAEVCKLEWPEPLRDGSFLPPDGWWS